MIREAFQRWLGVGSSEAQRTTEAVDLGNTYIDPRDAYRDELGFSWLAIGSSGTDEQEPDAATEGGLGEIRRICRHVSRRSAYAIGAHQARISYTVGTGHKYTAVAKRSLPVTSRPSDRALAQVQTFLDEWFFQNDWCFRQEEALLRYDRDGEVFFRFFFPDDDESLVRVRFVEPSQVYTPAEQHSNPHNRFGIETDPQDVETVKAYWIDGQAVDPTLIQHRKANVDLNVRRGRPLLWPVIQTLSNAKEVNRNMAQGSAIQTGIAAVRKMPKGTTKEAAGSFRSSKADFTRTDSVTGKTQHLEPARGGRILTIPAGLEYEFPFATTRYDQYVAVLQSNLREVASMLQMAEFMLTADASNNNYASIMVAEGPAVKMFERLQARTREKDLAVLWYVIELAVQRGILPESVLESVEIQVAMPGLVTRDELKDVQVCEKLFGMGIVSPQTIAGKFDLDYEQEQENIEAVRDTFKPLLMKDDGDGEDGKGKSKTKSKKGDSGKK